METKGIRTISCSVVTALILSAILLLLVPRWLFKGDARWTYQNDTARVDVSFSGHLRNARVSAECADLRISQPAWLSNGSYQGTVVEFPVSYGTKSFQIKLSPKADVWGEDATLIIKFRGQDFRHRGKRRPAWVTFRNITLNGKPVAGEKIVWHNTPFVLEYPPHSAEEIVLTFDVCKPIAASDISFKGILGVFSACLLLCLFFSPFNTVKSRVSEFITEKDIIKILLDGYHHIDPVYRRSFWIIFGVLCFAFGFHTICFMWGNHDWGLLERKGRWLLHAESGRYMIYSIKMLFSKGIYLPIFFDLITFVTLAFNAVLLCKYWRLEKRVVYFVLCGLILTVQPFTLTMVYYINMLPEVFIGVTCVLVALSLSERVASVESSVIKKIIYSLIAIVLISFALAMYPVLLNTIAVVLGGRLLVQSFHSWHKIKSYLRVFIITVVNTVLGIVSYKLIITFVFPMQSMYNTDTLSLHQMPGRLAVLFRQCFHQLYEYNFPFTPQWILWIFLGFTTLLALYACFTGNFKQRLVRFSLIFGTLFATQTTMIIAKTHMIDGRVELFGLVFFETLVTVLIITRFRKFHNLWVITSSLIIFASVLHDLDCLRVWKLGFDAEKMLWNRILVRLESLPKFDPTKKYKIIQIGDPIALRKRYYTGQIMKFHWGGLNLLNYSYDAPWDVFHAPELYYPSHFRKDRSNCRDLDYSQLKHLYQAGVLQKAEVWPKANGLVVWKDIILFVTDGKRLHDIKRQFEQETRKR